jgi:glutathione S-transferase
MLLYFMPGACSLASRIALIELNLPFETSKVDMATGQTDRGVDFRTVNPKGYVPALAVEPDTVITENPAILQYIADRGVPSLAPAPGTIGRVRLQEWLNFTSSELHKAFSPWFSGRELTGEALERAQAVRDRRIGDVEQALSDGRAFIVGDSFTVADAYLFVVLSWSGFIGLDLAPWPGVAAYVARIRDRPAVRAALVAEGLAPAEGAA